MFRSFGLGRALGIPLFVHWSFFLLPLWALLASLSQGLVGVLFTEALLVAVFACVLAHELGHALMARYFGIATRDITLYPIGGVARLDNTGATPRQELAIALAGPAVNLAVVALLLPVVALSLVLAEGATLGLAARFLAALCGANALLLCFNLIPAFPMDGGRVLRAVLELSLGRLRATEIAAAVGLGLSVLLGVVGMLKGIPTLLLVAVFVGFAGQMELRALRQDEAERRSAAWPGLFVPRVLAEPTPQESGQESPAGFTGFAWDREARVWVRWVKGRPVEVFG